MHKHELLRQRAEAFRQLLEEYAREDPDVEDFRERFMQWHDKILRRKIRLPCKGYDLDAYFFRPDFSPLFGKYALKKPQHPLSKAAMEFSEAIHDQLSDPSYIDFLKRRGVGTGAILDEPPPPEDETPLAQEEPPKPSFLGRLSRRAR